MKRLALVLSLVVTTCVQASISPGTPSPLPIATRKAAATSPAVAQAGRLIQGAHTLDEAAFRRLVEDIYPTVDFATAEWTEMRGHLATMRLHGVIAATATHAELSLFNTEMET